MNGTAPIRSPFKFLDPYSRQDRHIFFGRDEEVERLYESVNKNRVVMVYGQSGTGKTSLVQCGLANRFEVTDWLPFFIRRGADINNALYQILGQSKAIGGSTVDQSNILSVLERISDRYVRPVYLIFDQFEELMILGSREEKELFKATIKAVAESGQTQSTYLIFILREEYFGRLDEFETVIPGFSDRRLRVEPMRTAKLEEVILQTCNSFRIRLENGRENALQIIKSLRSKGGISLPYLQVYLDMLWREDFERTHLSRWEEPGYPPLEFTTQEIQAFGNIENVLGRFLDERKQDLQNRLAKLFPDFPADGVMSLLDAFVTEESTKRPLYFTREEDRIEVEQSSTGAALRQKFPPPMLTASLEALEESRLLRADENTFELAHDSLAALIDEQRSDEQKQLNRIRQRLNSAFREFQETGEFLSEKQLLSMEEYLSKIETSPNIRDFIKESSANIQNRKLTEKAAQERELQEQKRQALKEQGLRKEAESARNDAVRNARRSRWLAVAGFLLFFMALAGSAFAFVQQKKAQEAQEKAEVALAEKQESEQRFRSTNYEKNLQLGRIAMDQGDFRDAAEKFQVAITFDSTRPEVDALIRIALANAGLKATFDSLMSLGNQAFSQQNYLSAVRHFRAAWALDLGPGNARSAELKIEETTVRLIPKLQQHLENADGFIRAERKDFAQRELDQVDQILPYLDRNRLEQEIRYYNRLKTQIK